jgi:hypothetical protein
MGVLTARWTRLKYHKEQARLWRSMARFCVVPAGRRSGKTEIAKRKLVKAAMNTRREDAWFVAAAPTHKQARQIYWDDLRALVPKAWRRKRDNESRMTIHLINGADITVMGLDQPDRIEGRPLDGIVLDEYGNMKPKVWDENVRPALSTIGRPGWAWFIGVPEGRNHYHKLWKKARTEDEWDVFHWKSAEILDPEEVAQAKRDMDPILFDQEYNASWVTFTGRAYYCFDWDVHAKHRLRYIEGRPLIFCFDFNREPGIAVVVQEQGRSDYPGVEFDDKVAETFTAVIGEVYIPRNSNSRIVARRLVNDWKDIHIGTEGAPAPVYVYGDATGAAGGSAKVEGSDWELVFQELRKVPEWRVVDMVPRSNPRERQRVNSVNTRLENAEGEVRALVDPVKAEHTADDLDGVTVIEGGNGEIDKKADKTLTHPSDGWGYYVHEEHPSGGGHVLVSQVR